ncbi:MAG: hypothetical protein H0W36_00605, partial [Gemmatimonadetes bacterium]|nr:hypothetical protein [Gemmatimonadota bacterium]
MPVDTFTGAGEVAILATAFVTLITTLATLLYQFVSAGRRHSWEIEAARRHVEVSLQAETERPQLALKVDEAEVKLNAKIDENTEISKAAFVEANHMNEKLKIQNAAFDKLLEVAIGRAEVRNDAAEQRNEISASSIEAVKSTVDDTAE